MRDYSLRLRDCWCWGGCKALSFQYTTQYQVFKTVKQNFQITPAKLPPSSTFRRPHDAKMRKTFSFRKEGYSEVCFTRHPEVVRIVNNEFVEPFRYDKDLVVAHIRTGT